MSHICKKLHIWGISCKRTGFVQIKKDSIKFGDDVFVFAAQCTQVYYTEIPSMSRDMTQYWSVVHTRPRARVEIPLSKNTSIIDEVFQAEEIENEFDHIDDDAFDVGEPSNHVTHLQFEEVDENEALLVHNSNVMNDEGFSSESAEDSGEEQFQDDDGDDDFRGFGDDEYGEYYFTITEF